MIGSAIVTLSLKQKLRTLLKSYTGQPPGGKRRGENERVFLLAEQLDQKWNRNQIDYSFLTTQFKKITINH